MQEILQQAVDTLRGIWHRRWAGLTVAWVLGIAGLLVAARLPQYYEASTRVYVDTQTVLKPLLTGLAIRSDDAQQVGALSRILITNTNVAKVVEMTHYPLSDTPGMDRERQLDEIAKRLSITSGGQNNLYTLAFRDADPEAAKRVVGTLQSVFVDSTIGGKRADADQARRFIEEEIKAYEAKLQEAEDRVKQFKLQHMGMIGADGKDYYSRMMTLSQEREQARTDVRVAEEARDAIKRELSGEDPVFLDLGPGSAPEASTPAGRGVDPELDARIESLRKNLDELLRRYTDAHPDVVGTRRVLAQLEEERAHEVDRVKKAAAAAPGASAKPAPSMGPVERNPVYQRLKVSLADAEADVASARARASAIEAQYQQLNAAARMVPEVEAQFVQLTRDYDIQKKNYEALVARRETAAISSNAEEASASIFRVVEPPRVSEYPVAPNRALVILLVLLGSLGGGMLVSFLYSQIQPILHDTRTLRSLAGRPLLGAISQLPNQGSIRGRRLKNYAFAAALACLVVGLGVAALVAAANSRIT